MSSSNSVNPSNSLLELDWTPVRDILESCWRPFGVQPNAYTGVLLGSYQWLSPVLARIKSCLNHTWVLQKSRLSHAWALLESCLSPANVLLKPFMSSKKDLPESCLSPAEVPLESCLSPAWALLKPFLIPANILFKSCLSPTWVLLESFLIPAKILFKSCLSPVWVLQQSFWDSLSPAEGYLESYMRSARVLLQYFFTWDFSICFSVKSFIFP